MKKPNLEMVYNIREISSIRELVETSCTLYEENTAFLRHSGDNIEEIKYKKAYGDIVALSTYFNSLGLENKKIAVIGKNSYEWAITYLAVCAGTGIIVPLDKELKSAEIEYLLENSGSDAIVYSHDAEAKISETQTDIRKLCMQDFPKYISEGMKLLENGDKSYQKHNVNPYALGILIYTSGTTGVAKGVMLSQNNICSDFIHVLRTVKVSTDDRVISILPLHHTYECTAGFLSMFFSGASIAYNDSLRQLQSDMLTFKPTIFIAVPLLLESFLSNVKKKYAKLLGGKAIFNTQKVFSGLMGKDNKKASKRIFSSVNAAFGGRMRAILCGAASLSPEVFKEYERFGFDVYIGYGLTETSPVCIMHDDFYRSPDDIGYPICGVEAKLSEVNEDGIGELIVKGANVMLGYYNNQKETDKVLRDGWFYTGDLAKIADNGAFQITGRIKSMIVTPNGKKIFPEELEYYIDDNKYVKESMVYGNKTEDDVEVTASIYPDYELIDKELEKHGTTPSSPDYSDKIKEIFNKVIKEVNKKVPNFKHISKLIIRKNEFEKTTTKKIKRQSSNNYDENK